jgi:hypothetical protein
MNPSCCCCCSPRWRQPAMSSGEEGQQPTNPQAIKPTLQLAIALNPGHCQPHETLSSATHPSPSRLTLPLNNQPLHPLLSLLPPPPSHSNSLRFANIFYYLPLQSNPSIDPFSCALSACAATMLLKTLALVLAAAQASAQLAQTNLTQCCDVAPSQVSLSSRQQWCLSQRQTCPQLCPQGIASVNDCDSVSSRRDPALPI